MEKYRIGIYDSENNITYINNLEPVELNKAINAEDDNGGFNFYSTTITTPIKPYTLAKLQYIKSTGATVTYEHFWISSQPVQVNETKYKHNASIIELTKLLEQIYFGNATSTNPIDRTTGEPITNKTMKDVIDRLCRIVKTKPSSDIGTLRFILDPDIEDRVDAIPAREFTFAPTKTFYEVLKQCGEYMQAELRMKITFDEFGERQYLISFDFWNDKTVNENGGDYLRHIKSLVVDQYHTNLVSDVSNVYPENGEDASAIITPTLTPRVRSGTYYDSSSDLIVQMPQKIDKVKKLYAINIDADVWSAGVVAISPTIDSLDITRFLYEKKIYDTLDQGDDEGEKGRAIFYEQYGELIDGLMYKAPAIFSFLEVEAIILILETIVEEWVNDNYPAISVSSIDITTAIMNLEFKCEFEPLQSLFTKHTKVVTDKTEDADLVFNQTENIVDSSSFGTAVKQASDKMANDIFEKDYKLDSFEDIIPLGAFNDDNYFVTRTKIQIFSNYIKQTVSWSNNYVALSEWVGIDSLNRQYQVPASGDIVERKIHYKEYVDLSFTRETLDIVGWYNYPLIPYMFYKATDTTRTTNEIKPVDFAVVAGIDKNDVLLNLVILTATSIGVGDKVNFNFKMQDNYSAGKTTEAISGKTQRQQIDYPYADEYGEIEKLVVAFMSGSEFDSYTTAEITTQAKEYPKFSKGAALIANTVILFNSSLTDTLWIEKDARETLNFTYELQFTTNDDDIIIGSYLAESNAMVENFIGKQLYVWLSNTEINKNTRYVPSDAVQISDLDNVMPNGDYITTSMFLQTGTNYTGSFATHKCWLVADEDGKVFLGANQNLNDYTPVSNVFEETQIYFNGKKEI